MSVVGQGIPESAIEAALSRPGVMIVSDAGDIETGNEHPRGAGHKRARAGTLRTREDRS